MIAVGFNFAPVGWALCQGQLLPISEYQTLFQLIGTTFGGDGQTTFGLPDLRGRAALGMGQGPGLGHTSSDNRPASSRPRSQAPQIGSHTHGLSAAATATTADPFVVRRSRHARRGDADLRDGRTGATLTAGAVSRPRAADSRTKTGSRA